MQKVQMMAGKGCKRWGAKGANDKASDCRERGKAYKGGN